MFRSTSFYFLSATLLLHACSPVPSKTEEEYYTVADFEKVPKIDTHIHIFTDRGDFMDLAKTNNFKVVNVALTPAMKWMS